MKKILFFVCMAAAMVGCDKKTTAVESANDSATGDSISIQEKAPCPDPINNTIRRYATQWCAEDATVDHSIPSVNFDKAFNDKWGSGSNILYKKISWGSLQSIIGNYTCYEKYLQFNYDAGATSNASITPMIVDCFSVSPPCYSISLIKSIAQKNNMQSSDDFEFSLGIINNKEGVIFRAKNAHGTFDTFDVSHWPKSLKDKIDKAYHTSEK